MAKRSGQAFWVPLPFRERRGDSSSGNLVTATKSTSATAQRTDWRNSRRRRWRIQRRRLRRYSTLPTARKGLRMRSRTNLGDPPPADVRVLRISKFPSLPWIYRQISTCTDDHLLTNRLQTDNWHFSIQFPACSWYWSWLPKKLRICGFMNCISNLLTRLFRLVGLSVRSTVGVFRRVRYVSIIAYRWFLSPLLLLLGLAFVSGEL